MRRLSYILSFSLLLGSCKRDEPVISLAGSGYPNKIGKIILSNCATSGCHNDKSKEAASGLSLQTWDQLFEGGRSGPCVIPYRSDFSTLCYFSNTYPSLGLALKPTMPIDKAPLSETDYLVLRDWIAQGAPNDNGFVKFSDEPSRKKIYVTNLLCDVVTVFDSQTLIPMRYIDVGQGTSTQYPGAIHVSPDGQYWYVTFLYGNVIQKYRTSDDSYVGELNMGAGSYHSFAITPNSKNAFCLDYASPGKIIYVDLQSMTVLSTYLNGNNFLYPKGAAVNASATVLYVGAQFGNFIYKIDITNPLVPIVQEKQIDGSTVSDYNSVLDPYELALSPDGSKYFITCQNSMDLRVMKVSNDSLLAVIPMDYYPQQMSFSSSTNYMFVTCAQDTITFPGKRGSVAVVDYQSNALVKKVYAGWESYGVGVDDSKKVVCVSNMNINTGGPGPHHSTNCGGRNGYATFIDLNSLTLLPQKIELANVPYAIAVRK